MREKATKLALFIKLIEEGKNKEFIAEFSSSTTSKKFVKKSLFSSLIYQSIKHNNSTIKEFLLRQEISSEDLFRLSIILKNQGFIKEFENILLQFPEHFDAIEKIIIIDDYPKVKFLMKCKD